MSPQHTSGRVADQNFGPQELLFRRIPNSHIEDGEISILAISCELRFQEAPPKCTSVVRSGYASSHLDCLHPDCADRRNLSATHSIWHLRVCDLPTDVMIDPLPPEPTPHWGLYPHHDPLPSCYAHSTICSDMKGQPKIAVCPPKSVRNAFRKWIAENLTASAVQPAG